MALISAFGRSLIFLAAQLSVTTQHSVPAPRKTRLRNVFALYRERRALAQLDNAALRDIGITRHDAEQEVGRSAWDIPSSWRR